MLNKQDKIFLAGSSGMVGSAIKRAFTNLDIENNNNSLDLIKTLPA